nr:hypothetical protein [uncultured Azospirillum sp.]
MTEKTNVTPFPVHPRPRMIRNHSAAERVRGAAADIRDFIAENTIDLDGLREIARRLDAVAGQMEGR